MSIDFTHLIESAITLEKVGSLFLIFVGGSVVYLVAFAVPPMIREFLKSMATSLERISVTLAEVVLTNGRIHVDVGEFGDFQAKHHENALAIKEVVHKMEDKVDKANDTLFRIETTLRERLCVK